MIATGHTPGPWKINTAGMAINGQPFKITEVYVFAPGLQDDVAICAEVIDPASQKPSQANARLIAAAPELLEALKSAKWMLERDRIDDQKMRVPVAAA